MRIIGLTGGLGTGKSTVAQILEAQRIPVWDADVAARKVVAPGMPALERITAHFGSAVIAPTGTLKRDCLGAIIFADPQQRLWLETLIHPLVRHDAQQWLAQQIDPVVTLVIPLLFEAQMTDLVTEIWVVTCAATLQRARIRARDQLTDAQITQRLASQWSLERKVALAQVVIHNDGSRDNLADQVLLALRR